jgi:hypothetical protein
VKTVGVMGGGRTYEYVVGLRAVTSTEGMTADFFDVKFLGAIATRIVNDVKGVNCAEFAGGHLVRVMRPWRVVPAWRNSTPQLRPAGCCRSVICISAGGQGQRIQVAVASALGKRP